MTRAELDRGALMRVVVCLPREAPAARQVHNASGALQELVGGFVQRVPLRGTALDDLDVYVNEDGMGLALPFNRKLGGHVLLGPIVVSKADEAGDQISLSPEDVARALAVLDGPDGG